MNTQLQQLGAKRTVGGGCKCASSQLAYNYVLPQGLDISIEGFLSALGTSSTSFEKQAILKIENQDFSITGIRRLKQIKLIIKNNDASHLVDKFEEALAQWLESRK